MTKGEIESVLRGCSDELNVLEHRVTHGEQEKSRLLPALRGLVAKLKECLLGAGVPRHLADNGHIRYAIRDLESLCVLAARWDGRDPLFRLSVAGANRSIEIAVQNLR
jgi:hypothetical protein